MKDDKRPVVIGLKAKHFATRNAETGSVDEHDEATEVKIFVDGVHNSIASLLEFQKQGITLVSHKNCEHHDFTDIREYIDARSGKGLDPLVQDELRSRGLMGTKIENAKKERAANAGT
jgi:hypothetical protein